MNMLTRLCRALACTALTAAGAHAADRCASQASALSRQACLLPATAALQDRMARDLARASKSLSADGARKLRASQQAWRRFVDQSCDESSGSTASGQDEGNCVVNALYARITELAQVGLHAGPFVLTRVDRYDITPAPVPANVSPEWRVLPLRSQIGYPKIDGTASQEALDWNRDQEQHGTSEEDGRPSDEYIGYVVGCASDRLLSLQVVRYQFSQGAAHGTSEFEVRNYVVGQALRAMTPDDLFAPASGWEDTLPDLVWQVYLDRGGKYADDPKFEANVRAAATEPDHWLLTPRGLEISFSSYEAGCYACGPGPLTVPWPQLAPMLANKATLACETGAKGPG